MIVAEDFARRPLAADPGSLEDFAPEEKRYLAGLADPAGSIAARRLAKERVAAVLERLGHRLEPGRIAILPGGGPGQGPPRIALPVDPRKAWGLGLHLSLSHSAASVAVWLVVEELD